jgi:hypothetical protein
MISLRPSAARYAFTLLVWLAAAVVGAESTGTVHAVAQGVVQVDGPVVGGAALTTTMVAGWPVHYDRDVPPSALATANAGFEAALQAVSRVTGLPPFGTPLVVYVLADQHRFRAALQEIGGVRTDLVGLDIGGYTIERDGTMLIFFPYQVVDDPLSATVGFAHELAHLAVREASARRPVPQWFNEGFAQWASYRVLAEVDPIQADELLGVDRAIVASALHNEVGLLPWATLVTRTRFSRSGTEGWAGLAYGQGTLFVDWLGRRHGVGTLGTFLQRIGSGAGATEAFSAAFGPFGPEEAAFRASLESLKAEFRPGLRRVTRELRPGRPVLYALVGGRAGEQIAAETFVDGALARQYGAQLDPAGFGVVGFDAVTAGLPGEKRIRVSAPSLGVLEAVFQADGTFVDAPPRRAPVQIPAAPMTWQWRGRLPLAA